MKPVEYLGVGYLFLGALGAQAQGPLSLPKALATALESNYGLKSAKHELKVIEGRAMSASSILNPDVQADIGKTPPATLWSSDNSRDLSFSQTIEISGKRSLRSKAAYDELDAARAGYRALELDLARKVKQAYWDLSLARERVNFAEVNLKFQQRFFGLVQDRFQSGQVKLADVSRARLEVARATNELLVDRKNIKMGNAQLNRLMGQSVTRELDQPEHLREEVVTLIEEDLALIALKERPERQALAFLREGALAQTNLASRLLWAPDLKTSLRYERGERGDGRDSWAGQIGLTLPLWYGYQGERLSSAKRLESLEAQQKELEQSIVFEVHQAYLELNLSAEQIKLWKEAVDQATEAARLAEQQYKEGDVDLLIPIQTRRDLVNTTLDYLGELRDYKENLAALEKAIGRDLEAK